MKQKARTAGLESEPASIRLTWGALIALCATLILTTGLIVNAPAVLRVFTRSEFETVRQAPAATHEVPPWGELRCDDVQVCQPVEYAAFEVTANRTAVWHFGDKNAWQVSDCLARCGVPPAQVERVVKNSTTVAGTTIELRPDDDLLLSLTAEGRAALYTLLAKDERNRYMRSPYFIPDGNIEAAFASTGVDSSTIALVKKLSYGRAGFLYFSDPELVLHRLPTEEARLKFMKVLTGVPAVLPHLRIRPTTDIKRVLSYWTAAPFVRFKDTAPLLESLTRLPGGAEISLVYLLPPFARERLFTSPLPSKTGDVPIDCHWSTMNFFKEKPDDRFADQAFTSAYIGEHYYQVAKPSAYGDLVLILDDQGGAIHSGVHIADDIVFTKNGVNYAQPWLLMRLKNMLGMHVLTEQPRVAYFRLKSA